MVGQTSRKMDAEGAVEGQEGQEGGTTASVMV